MISTMSISLTPNLAGFNSLIIVFFVIASMTYFLFTVRGKEAAGSKMNPLLSAMMSVGQYVLMGAIGAGFAASFLGRLAVFMDILERVVYFIPRMLGLM